MIVKSNYAIAIGKPTDWLKNLSLCGFSTNEKQNQSHLELTILITF